MRSRTALVLGLSLLIALLVGTALGPAPSKLEDMFGLVGWAARVPFYLLLFYVGPVVLAARDRAPWWVVGVTAGVAAGLPLGLLAFATACPIGVQFGYPIAAVLEGLVLARIGLGTPSRVT